MDIDFVLPWVDGDDPQWRQKFLQYFPASQYKPNQYRDWGTLRYWFRAVEKFAPWVHRIYFVTDDQWPDWLRSDHPKIRWVKHSEYIPQDYLPTFCTQTIELNFHRLPDLSEHFVLFNDDMFLNAPIEPEYFFKDRLPVDATCECFAKPLSIDNDGCWIWELYQKLNVGVLNRHFLRRASVKECPYKWHGAYLGFKNRIIARLIDRWDSFQAFQTGVEQHQPQPYLKETFQDAWDKEKEWLHKSCLCKTRTPIKVNSSLFRYWQLAGNQFYPKRKRNAKFVILFNRTQTGVITKILTQSNAATVCFNDVETCSEENYLRLKAEMQQAFEQKFPNKSSFEL
jgi:hypothetical protein